MYFEVISKEGWGCFRYVM